MLLRQMYKGASTDIMGMRCSACQTSRPGMCKLIDKTIETVPAKTRLPVNEIILSITYALVASSSNTTSRIHRVMDQRGGTERKISESPKPVCVTGAYR